MEVVRIASLTELLPEVLARGVEGFVFDAFGTLVKIDRPRNPYGKAILSLKKHYSFDNDARIECMTTALDFRACLKAFDPAERVAEEEWLVWEKILAEELTSVVEFDDTPPVLDALRGQIPMVICSNLATPYAKHLELNRVLHGIPKVWSCEQGKVKPDPALFLYAAQSIGLNPSRIWMVGDSWNSDVLGAEAAGFGGAFFLERPKMANLAGPSSRDPIF